jgi:ATP-binding cassette subfamily B protein
MKKSSENTTKQTLQLFWQHAWRYKPYVVGLMLTVPSAVLTFRFLPPLIVARILERIGSDDYTRGDVWQSFGTELVWYAGLTLLGGIVLWRIAIILIWKLEMRVIQDIHQRVFNHLMGLSAGFHANSFGGSLVSQANKLAGAYIRIADTTIFQLSGLVLSFVFTIVILAPRAPMVVLLLLFFSLLFMFSAVRVTRRVRQLNAIEASATNRQTGFLADAVTNVMAVKSFSAASYEKKRYAQATQTTRDATNDLMKASVVRDLFFSGTTTAISVISLFLAVISVVLFDANIATVYLVVNYTGIITQNLWDFSQSTLRNYNRGLGDARDMVQILAIKPDVKDPLNPEPVHIHRGDIRFENVTFYYPDSKDNEPLFQGLDLRIKPGEKVGLVGHSGGGKTTITKLLLRFVDIQSGQILIDGQEIRQLAQADLRSRIAYVPQESLLFHRSLMENIRYGRFDASDREVIAVAKMANAHEFIEKLPHGYETLVGERGVKLSGGQRQRITIARAMLKNAPILLLDEATSALDSESEELIQDALWRLMEGRTAIVIAHRLSTIQKMDRIIVLEEGAIAEQGSHKELIRAQGPYARLWLKQSGGFLEE